MSVIFSTIGIIGAGQMGSGIAQVSAHTGSKVIIYDVNFAQCEKSKANIAKNCNKLLEKQKMTAAEMTQTLANITITDKMADLRDCEFIIEAATENEKIKKDIFTELMKHINDDCLLASNTSSISITRLGANTNRPEKFCGVHFMNPVPVMRLVELIRGLATKEEHFHKIESFVRDQLGKTIAVAEDFPAFIVNRILLPMINEAAYVLYEGVGNVQSIDYAMKFGTNHPMGPLELADFIGLDTCYSIMNVLYNDLADSKYRPCPLLVKYVEAGWLGRKTGRGFYDYTSGEPKPTR